MSGRCLHRENPNPRWPSGTCVKCGHPMPAPDLRERDLALERKLTAEVALGRGHTIALADGSLVGDTGGLDDFADHRALPGGVRRTLDPIQEAREELADARNYLCWGVERVHDRYLAGEPEAAEETIKLMNALAGVVDAWMALRDVDYL